MIDALFWIFNAFALVGWAVFFGFSGWTMGWWLIVGLIILVIFAFSYAVLFVLFYFQVPGGFESVEVLLALLIFDFVIVLAVWLYFFAFDLLIGWMILEELQIL